MELNIPAIEGIGGSLIYLVDRYGERTIYDVDFVPIRRRRPRRSRGPRPYIDHLTHNVHRGNMDKWAGFYERLFNFREIRYFDIEGKKTGLLSRAMTSPCGKIRIPINESQDDKSQIEEYLREYQGEGIQHIALGTDGHLRDGRRAARPAACEFQDTPDTYYEGVDERVPGHRREPSRSCRSARILIDGNPQKGEGLLLQIFTQNVIGPIFFEIIQRKGNEGFGEGNFRALFESIELRSGTARSVMMKRYIPVSARRRQGVAPGALRPAGGHLRARDQQGRLLRPGRALSSPASTDGLDRISRGRLRPRAFDHEQRLGSHAQSPWQARRSPAQRPRARCASGAPAASMEHLARNADGDELLFVHAGARRVSTATTAISRCAPATTSCCRAARCGASSARSRSTALLIEATNASYELPDKGLLGSHAIFDPAMLDTPRIDDAFRAQQSDDAAVAASRSSGATRISTITYPVQPARRGRLARRPLGRCASTCATSGR